MQGARSECKRVKVAEANLLAHLSSGECNVPWVSCSVLVDYTPGIRSMSRGI